MNEFTNVKYNVRIANATGSDSNAVLDCPLYMKTTKLQILGLV